MSPCVRAYSLNGGLLPSSTVCWGGARSPKPGSPREGFQGARRERPERWWDAVTSRAGRNGMTAPAGSPPIWRSRAWLGRCALVAIVYFGAARGGLALAYEHDQVTAVWPPSGIALAAMFLWGYRVWPGVLLGAFLANVWADAPLLIDVGIALGNTAEGMLGVALLRSSGFHPSLARVRDVVGLAVFAAGLSTMVSATVGTASLWFWRRGLIGRSLRDLEGVVARGCRRGLAGRAAVDARCDADTPTPAAPTPGHRGGVSLVVLLGASVFAFSEPGRVFVVFPALIWAALRFRQPGATTGSVAIAGLAIWFTAHDTGPFVTGSPDEGLCSHRASWASST